MKLRPPSYLVLGMLHLGARSGYAIKKATDISTRAFFPTSLAQIYPELARLDDDGLVTRREDPHGGRSRLAYRVTDQGEAALLRWLGSERLGVPQFRDEGVLRLFFADALPQADQVALARRLSARARAVERWMEADALPAAEALKRNGFRHPHTVARLGIDTYGFLADWFDALAAELASEDEVR